ncbi:hypothetical protein D3C73_1564140 [compost metagenome]
MKFSGVCILALIQNTIFPSKDGSSDIDFDKIFALQTNSKEDLPPLENIEQRMMDTKYISKDA